MPTRASDLINHCRTLAGDPEADYHDDTKMLLHLNTSLRDIALRSRTFCEWIYMAMISGQGTYGLPDRYLEAKYVGYRYQGKLRELTPGGTSDVAPAVFDETLRTNSIPWSYADGGAAQIEKAVTTVESSEISNEGETQGYGDFVSTDPVPNAISGDTLINVTDGSEGVISEPQQRDDDITFLYHSLAGGEDNKLEADDVIRILSRSAHLHSITIAPPPGKTDEIGKESLFAYIAALPREIQSAHIQADNDFIEIAQEFEPALRQRIMYYMRFDQDGATADTTQSHEIRYETDYATAYPKANRRIRQYLTSWKMAGQRIPRAIKITATGDWSSRLVYR